MSACSFSNPIKIRGVDDVINCIDSRGKISGRAGVIWWLALGGLFLDAFSNSALSAGLNPMTRNLNLSATEVALLTSFSSWVAILFNPIGGWIADRWGRVPPLIIAKIMAVIGALLVMSSSSFSTIIVGRFFVGVSYGMDFAVAMAMLAEFTPVKLKSRLNTWQGVWYVAVCLNLALALMFYSWDVGDAIWRYSIAVTALCGLIVLFFQFRYLVESPVWLARKSRLSDAVIAMNKIYGDNFILAPKAEQKPVIGQAEKGARNVLLIFRGVYLPRTILASTVQICQSIQYFGVGWYLPVISAAMFGKNFVYATLCSLFLTYLVLLAVSCLLQSVVVWACAALRRSVLPWLFSYCSRWDCSATVCRCGPLCWSPRCLFFVTQVDPVQTGKAFHPSLFAVNCGQAQMAWSVRWGQ